jgi:hypothetical protein
LHWYKKNGNYYAGLWAEDYSIKLTGEKSWPRSYLKSIEFQKIQGACWLKY